MTGAPALPLLAPGRTATSPRIAYAECGHGSSAVFFLHGIGGNKDNWTEQLRFFAAAGYRVLAWDVRGYGDSDDFEGPFDFAEVSADLAALMDHAGVARAHFVGLSMGGRILMDFGHRYPGRVLTLTICGAFPSFGKALDAQQRNEYLRLRQEPLLAGRTFEELAPQLITSLAGPGLEGQGHAQLHASICRLRKSTYLKALEAAVDFDRLAEIRRIQAPTLLLYAGNDRLAPPAMGREVAAMMPRARIGILEGCGHLMNLEKPREFNRAVLEFIQQYDPQRMAEESK